MPTNKKVKCKECGKRFEALSPRASLCPGCKKKKAAARRSKRQQKGKGSLAQVVTQINSISNQDELVSLFPPEIWEQIPVDIDTFMFDRRYLGNAWLNGRGEKTMFPFWEKLAHQVYPLPMRSPYNTIILSGSTGCGKTSFSMGVLLAYYLHIVLCLRNPHEYFDLADQKNIIFAVINIVTKSIAYKNAWGIINKMLIRSPWFMERGISTEGRRPEWLCTTKPVELIYGRNEDDLIGLDILFCFMDEVSFARNQSVERQIEIATEVFNVAWERMKSRFLKFGGIYEGLMVMASSKRTDVSFLEGFTKKILEDSDSRKVLVVDKARWEVLPPSSYSGKTFPLAVGDKFKPSQIIKEDEVDLYKKNGYNIMWSPEEYRSDFERDMQKALTNIAGISVGQISSFLRGELVQRCINPNNQNLFTESVIFSDYRENDQYYERMDLTRCRPTDFTLPLFIHVDASLGRDGNSISGVLVDYYTNTMTELGVQFDLHYRQLFKIKVRAPKNGQTGLAKNRQFIFWLRQQGFNIQGVSFDQYQSFETLQILEKAGFNVKKQSIDKVDPSGVNQPYEALKNALYENRIELLEDDDQTDELVSLERYENGKVDKPLGGCFTGDTKVRLVDGRSLSFLELVDEFQKGKKNWVYSMNLETKRIEPKPILRAWMTKKLQPLVEVTLDNGEKIKCTYNHLFMDRDGNYIEAKNLVEGQSLMPLYLRYPTRGLSNYRLFYEPFEETWHYEHRSFANGVNKGGYVVHHLNFNPRDNTPDNLIRITREEHVHIHQLASTGACSPEASKKRIDSRLKWFREHRGSKELKDLNSKIRAGVLRYHGKDPDKIFEDEKRKIAWIEDRAKKSWGSMTPPEKSTWGVRYYYFCHPELNEKSTKRLKEYNSKFSAKKIKGRVWYNNGVTEILIDPKDPIPEGYVKGRGYKLKTFIKQEDRHYGKRKERKNHKVVSVRFLSEKQDVYDLCIPDNHNFALDSGIFVHNSDDAAQCLAGALFLASQCKEELLHSGAILLKALDYTNSPGLEKPPEEKIQEEITRHFANYSPDQARVVNQRSSLRETYDDVFGLNENKNKNKKGVQNNPTMYWG